MKSIIILKHFLFLFFFLYSFVSYSAPSSKNVLFLVNTETIGGKGVYELYREMKKVGHDVKVIAIPNYYNKKLLGEIDLNFTHKFDDKDVLYPCGKSAPYTQCKSIDLNPADYIFVQNPYDSYANSILDPFFLNSNLKKFAKKIMFIVYGPHIFHQDFINDPNLPNMVHTVFVDSESTKDIYVKKYDFPEDRVVVSGYQPYKEVRDGIKKVSKKKQETILWLPRWHLSLNNKDKFEGGSTFLIYHHFLYNYAKENPHINFIIRPHLLLLSVAVEQKFLSQDELDDIFNKFSSLSNVKVSMHLNRPLSDDIIASDIIISDGTSALGEVVVADKPIIYLSNGWNNEFNSNLLSKEFKNYIYFAYNPKDILDHIDHIRLTNYHPYEINHFSKITNKINSLNKKIDNFSSQDDLKKIFLAPVKNSTVFVTSYLLDILLYINSNLYSQDKREKFKKNLDPVENPAEYIAQYLLND